ncbi:MAG: hypothetical protein HY690_07670 [Chloroflexi bacterium]|nr:hypothetical protein [Chloroflexota bacterium]
MQAAVFHFEVDPLLSGPKMVRSTTIWRSCSARPRTRLGLPGWPSGTEQSDGAERPTLERALALASTAEAAARLGVSRGYLSRLIRAGHVPALRPATDHSYLPADGALAERTCQQRGASLAGLAKNRLSCDRCRAEWRRGSRARP